jgi:8-oxo-dGTP diphosphatase
VLPGGRIRRDEAPHEAALRELEEDTTLVADELMYLFQFSGLNTQHHAFFADVGSHLTAHCEVQVVHPGQDSNAFCQCAYFIASWVLSSDTSAFRNRITYGGRRST